MTPNRRVTWQAASDDENSWPRSAARSPRGRLRRVCCASGRQGQISLTSKIRTLDHLLEQAKHAAFIERAGVRHSIELRSFQPHVAPALNQSPMLASVFHPFDRSKLGKV